MVSLEERRLKEDGYYCGPKDASLASSELRSIEGEDQGHTCIFTEAEYLAPLEKIANHATFGRDLLTEEQQVLNLSCSLIYLCLEGTLLQMETD